MSTSNNRSLGETLRGVLSSHRAKQHPKHNRDYAVVRMPYLENARMASEMWHL
jgi:hypothetical protein